MPACIPMSLIHEPLCRKSRTTHMMIPAMLMKMMLALTMLNMMMVDLTMLIMRMHVLLIMMTGIHRTLPTQ